MSQDLWIATVRGEVETSPQFLQLHNKVVTWQMTRGLFDDRPDWFEPAVRQLSEMVDAERIAFEAGRRYQGALMEWRYRKG